MISPEQNLEQKKSPEEILRETGHVRDIIYSDKKDLEYQGEPISKQVFELSEKVPELKRAIIRTFSEYNQSPIILDDFEDDKARNEFENSFFAKNKKVYDFYQSNKLRVTNIRQLVHYFGMLDKTEEITDPELKELSERIWDDVEERGESERFKKYQNAPEAEKLRIVEKASQFARKVSIAFIDRNK